MADNESKNDKETRRFRLPKLFADDVDSTEGETKKLEDVAARANVLGVTLPAAADNDVVARANRPFETTPRAAVLPASVVENSASASAKLSPTVSVSADEFEEVATRIDELHAMLAEINDRGTAQDKVFNTLHNELQDYKNDFIYEHLKPVLRPLLFLFDSMELFDNEMHTIEKKLEPGTGCTGAAPDVVRANVQHFREQLIEALRICEVIPMQTPTGTPDPRLHKALTTVPVPPEQHGQIQRVVRSGWFLNGRVFRPAEVVVGKAETTPAKADVKS
ncbi:MAG TPA: nucleotide exchange factor GrpE [Abditibacteriaceae bacterium]|jgi:molecular chaperone GrpE (heat shock protein)